MRILLLCLGFIVLQSNSFNSNHEVLELRQAVLAKKVSMSAQFNHQATHYSNPVALKLTNISGVPLQILIPAGYRFNPSDTSCQPMLIVNSHKIQIAPGAIANVNLEAMCMAHSKSGPSTGLKYTLAKPIHQNLQKLAQKIENMASFGIEGQHAVWCLTDDMPIQSIYGADTAHSRILRSFVCKLKGIANPPPVHVQEDYRYNYYAPVVNVSERIWGKYEYKFASEKDITIAMFNERNTVVRELFKGEKVKPGNHVFNYEFDSSVYTDDSYRIMFIVDGKVLLVRNLNLNEWRKEHSRG